MGIYAAYDQLVTTVLLHNIKQLRSLKSAVAPFGQHDIRLAWGDLSDNSTVGWIVAKSRTPEILKQPPMLHSLVSRLC
ncbi:hypothetical protein D3C73_1023670 [compost metagenome]